LLLRYFRQFGLLAIMVSLYSRWHDFATIDITFIDVIGASLRLISHTIELIDGRIHGRFIPRFSSNFHLKWLYLLPLYLASRRSIFAEAAMIYI